MDIEYNEARVKDVEIVLFQFEQRVEKLEQQLLHDQYLPNEDEVVNAAKKRITVKPEQYFPTLYAEMKKMSQIKDQTIKLVKDVCEIEVSQKMPNF